MKLLAAVVYLAFAGSAVAGEPQSPDTSHLAFVEEYIRELSAMENLRASAETDLQEKDSNPLTTMIYYAARNQQELRASIGILKEARIGPPVDFVVGDISDSYRQKIAIYDQLTTITKTMMSGPKPGVDYGAAVARVPQLRAMLDDIDDSLIKISAAVFASLLDRRPDKEGHVSHLIITRQERRRLIDELQIAIGPKMNQKHQSAFVSSADVLDTYLRKKGYKCADEP